MREEAELIRRVVEGDVDGFRLLVERYQRPVFLLVRNLVPNRHTCEDIAQDVFVFINPNQRHVRYIKRVVALANDTIEIKDNVLFINGEELPRTKDADSPAAPANGEGEVYWETNGPARYRTQLAPSEADDPAVIADIPKTTIPQGHCYVLGDNRNNSRDSRHFGPIPLVDIVGRAERVYYPQWRKVE